MISPAQYNLISAALGPTQISPQIDAAGAVKALSAQNQQDDTDVEFSGADGDSGLQAGDPLVAKATGLGSLLDISA